MNTMTLEQVRDCLRAYNIEADEYHGKFFAKSMADAIDAHLNAAKGEAVEVSPEFTVSARAAIAWVLWHNQGSSSPIGQPLRFALGMGAHEQLQDWRIREAKHWAEMTKATTAAFHTASPDVVRDAERYRWLRKHSVFANDSMHELWFDASLDRGETEQLDKQIDAAIAAQEGGE